jgi:hypothetical protein
LIFFRFPSKPEVKEKWVAATCRGPVWVPMKTSTVCSVHFEETEYRPMLKCRRLVDWAVPTLNLPQVPNVSSFLSKLVTKVTYSIFEM